ncbi:hydroxymethylbilane synthase [Haloarcula rubripromontorii]|uniref:Hydroxymethylbilane synthase n=1 Tax=Haloarcula rubripromontorii TaxID=1705562 RepID=A0A0M9AP09_9EURY|nr:hydroxymethylbilane synthase [Haloarcula rubripromontorii]KOX94765.1 porphobilinogen deaminase [Haloarcula rubripromontorii]NLV07722.1 hydroxymethylbilane synthase [Haloarcula rubripromontorii]
MTTRGETLQLATRGSDLALRQAATVRDSLSSRRLAVELVEVETTGDQIRDELIHRLGKTGAFVRSLDEKVLAGELDAAVHSMKDMPTERPERLVVAAVPERAAAEDVLVTPDGRSLDELPDGATVGTSSLRRKAQLLAERDDLTVEPLRGNVDTRLAKLLAPSLQQEHQERHEAEQERKGNAGDPDTDEDEEHPYDRTVEEWFDDLTEFERRAMERDPDIEYDAIVLAKAGLHRAGLTRYVGMSDLDPERFVPAPGQGALAVTAVDGDLALDIKDRLDDPQTRVETTVERTILEELGGGCVAPIGVHAHLEGGVVHTRVRVLSQDGTEEVSVGRDIPAEYHIDAAQDLAAELADQGADDLIAEAKRDSTAADDDASTAREDDEE